MTTNFQTVTYSGSGLVFNNTFGSGATAAFENDVVAAEQYLQSQFHNACTVNCSFDVQALDPSFSGENSFDAVRVSYSTYVNALAQHATTPIQQAAVAALENLPDPSGGAYWDIPIGEARILGLASPNPGGTDDAVTLNSVYWTASALQDDPGDAEAVIEHEISEGIMGRIGSLGVADPGYWAPMDLFRFTAGGQRDFTGGQDGQPTYFSINGSSVDTGLQFHNAINASGQFDGEDLADWDQVGADANATDPFGPGGPFAGDSGTLSATDLNILEALGWTPAANPAPPGGTTANMIMNNPGNGDYEIYNIGGNQVLAAYLLGAVGSNWSFAGIGTFQAGDTSDMLLRNTTTGQFEAYYISNNNITGTANVGTVGTNWNFAGIGDFDGQSSLSELLLRNANSGAFELYQVAGGGVLSGSSVGAVGGNFTVEGFGHFSESATTQMLMEGNSGASAGQLELYTFQPGSASFAGIDVGKVGGNLTFLGAADLLGNGATQMVMQQNNGDLWLYSYNSSANALSGTEVGAVGGNFHVVGFGPFGTAGQDEMLMQNAAGDFEVYQYNASENAFVGSSMGAVGSPWTVDGIAANSTASASTAQLVQAMASMSNGAGPATASAPSAGAEISTPTLLAAPQSAWPQHA